MKEMRRYYTYGSGALSPEIIRSDPEYKYRMERHERKEREKEAARRREHRRNLRINRISAFTTCFGVILVSAALFAFVFLQNQVAASKKNISRLEDQITELTTINDATRSRIDASIDLTRVKEEAEGRMGMVYADADHIVYYQMSGSDYMTSL